MARMAVRANRRSPGATTPRRGRNRGKTVTRERGSAPLSPGDLLAVIDEIDQLEMTLETVPTLALLARMMDDVQRCEDPEERDGIARLGFRRRGIDVDRDDKGDTGDRGVKALRPWDSADLIDAGAAPELVVAAVRWRLQRISAALSGA